jgi:hypothetical protein
MRDKLVVQPCRLASCAAASQAAIAQSSHEHEHEHEQAEMIAASLFSWVNRTPVVLLHRDILLAKAHQLVYRGPAIWAGTA